MRLHVKTYYLHLLFVKNDPMVACVAEKCKKKLQAGPYS